MALETNKNVKPILKPTSVPNNTTMNLDKLNKEI